MPLEDCWFAITCTIPYSYISYQFINCHVLVTAKSRRTKKTPSGLSLMSHLGATKAWAPAAQATAITADFMVFVEVVRLREKDEGSWETSCGRRWERGAGVRPILDLARVFAFSRAIAACFACSDWPKSFIAVNVITISRFK